MDLRAGGRDAVAVKARHACASHGGDDAWAIGHLRPATVPLHQRGCDHSAAAIGQLHRAVALARVLRRERDIDHAGCIRGKAPHAGAARTQLEVESGDAFGQHHGRSQSSSRKHFKRNRLLRGGRADCHRAEVLQGIGHLLEAEVQIGDKDVSGVVRRNAAQRVKTGCHHGLGIPTAAVRRLLQQFRTVSDVYDAILDCDSGGR